MRIVYMGTPSFAVPALELLLATPRHSVVGVVTQPDRPKGRHLVLTPSPVREVAARSGVPVATPERIADAVQEIAAWRPDLIAVAAYGQFIPKAIRDLPPSGSINIHPSLLPKYRGAAPIQWAVANGDTITGVTIMHVAKVMDSGDIVVQREYPIGPAETAAELEPKLAEFGASLLIEAIDLIAAGSAPRVPQDESRVTVARKLQKSDAKIDWGLPARAIHDRIRGFQPWPGCHFATPGPAPKVVKVHRAVVDAASGQPGKMLDVSTKGVTVACGAESLRLIEVQPENNRPMTADAWARGARIECGATLT